jgi:hypothetical protein
VLFRENHGVGHLHRFAEFASEEEGWEFVRDLKEKLLMVSYNSQNAANSTLSEDAVTTLLATRPPAPEGAEFQCRWRMCRSG